MSNTKVLITGGAGFIGSNLIEHFLKKKVDVVCLDNLSTGFKKNLVPFFENPLFSFLEGDIRDLDVCKKAVMGCDFVMHQAAIGSVPRSIADPINTTTANINGFVNMLIAARDEGVKRFVYAASSSTYGDSTTLPKVENEIGKPLSPYAITKYVNELYAEVFAKVYGIECIGLRYFNVFGKNQSPEGAYAAVIPRFVMSLMAHNAPVINGNGTYSRDFTYIDNVIQANEKAVFSNTDILKEQQHNYYAGKGQKIPEGTLNEILNVACGEQTDLNQLAFLLRENLSHFDPRIAEIEFIHGPEREGDIAHSMACIDKAKEIIGYSPKFSVKQGLEIACSWYWENL